MLSSVWQADGSRVITVVYDGTVQTFTGNVPQPFISQNNGALRVTYPYTSPWYYAGVESISGTFVTMTTAAMAAFISVNIPTLAGVATSIAGAVILADLMDLSYVELEIERWWQVYMPFEAVSSHIFRTEINTTANYYATDGDFLGSRNSEDTFESYGGPYI